MANFRSRTEILDAYLNEIKALIPGVNLSDDSDWVIRAKAVAGVLEGFYAELRATLLDVFPSTARTEALSRHGETWAVTRRGATKWSGRILATGTNGATIPANTRLIAKDGLREYRVQTAAVIAGGFAFVNIESVESGALQNLTVNTVLTFEIAPPNVDATASVFSVTEEAEDTETDAAYALRILDKIQTPGAGGSEKDYSTWPFEASTAVVTVQVVRHARGLGTVDVYFTAGTKDIEAAITAEDPVERIPDPSLVTDVQAYLDARKPLTDNVLVAAPTEVPIAVTVRATPKGSLSLGDVQTKIEKEVKKYLLTLTAPPSKPMVVRASGIEMRLASLRAFDLEDWQVDPLDAPSPNRTLNLGEIASVGTISVVAL